jgi:hypothetical protein
MEDSMARRPLWLMIIIVFITACASTGTSSPAPIVTQAPGAPTAYPAPVLFTPTPRLPYPAPSSPGPTNPTIPPSGYEPQPGDDKLVRGEALLDLPNSSLVVKEGLPVEVQVHLKGNLPDPCHQLRVVVAPPDETSALNLEAYTLRQPGKTCLTVLKPFEASIPLGSYTGGEITVYVNGQVLGEFGVGYQPQPGDDVLQRDQVTFELERSKVLVARSQPVQVSAVLIGYLPDPCHHLRVVNSGADAGRVINLEAYSLVKPGSSCIEMIKPFQAIIPLGVFPTGHYILKVNGEVLGEFDG